MQDPEKRITNLEMSVAHLQHDLETLDKAVLDNTEKLDRVMAMLKRMNERFEGLNDDGAQERKAEDEKPPHY